MSEPADYRDLNEGLSKLRDEVQSIRVNIEGVQSSARTLKWLSSIVAAGMMVILFNVAMRAIDNESQVKIDTGEISAFNSALAVLLKETAENAADLKVNAQHDSRVDQVIAEHQSTFDNYVRGESARDEEFIKDIEDLKIRMNPRGGSLHSEPEVK